MRPAPADIESFRNASRIALPPLGENYIARIADELPWGEPIDAIPNDRRPGRIHGFEILLGRAVAAFVVLSVLGLLI